MVLIVDYGRKWCHFSFMGIRGLNGNNWAKCLILFVTALFTVEEWLNLFTLLNTGLSRQFYSELLQKIGHNSF